MFKILNKGISTPIAIGIILVLAVLVGGFTLWQYSEILKQENKLAEIELLDKKEAEEKDDHLINEKVTITTDKKEYWKDEMVSVIVKNNSNDLIYYLVDSCYCSPGEFGIEKYDNGEWFGITRGDIEEGIQCHTGPCLGCLKLEPKSEEILEFAQFDKIQSSTKYRLKLDFGKKCWIESYEEPDFEVYSNEFIAIYRISDWKTYRNEEYAYELQYPKSWGVSSEKQDSVLVLYDPNAGFIETTEGEILYNDEITIKVDNNPKDYSLEKWIEIKEDNPVEARFKKIEDILVSGIPVIRGTFGCCQNYLEIIFLKKDDNVFEITGGNLFFDHYDYEDIFKDVLSTFKFIENVEKFYCQTVKDCTKYRTCSEECVNREYEENNPYVGPQCGAPWEFGCKCVNNRCEIGDPSF